MAFDTFQETVLIAVKQNVNEHHVFFDAASLHRLYSLWTTENSFLVSVLFSIRWRVVSRLSSVVIEKWRQLFVCAGHNASSAGSIARLPRVPLRLPLCFLWRHSAKLHPSPQPGSQCISSQHATSRSVHAEPEGGHAARDHPCTSCHVQLCQLYSTAVVQKGWLRSIFLSLVTDRYLQLWKIVVWI